MSAVSGVGCVLRMRSYLLAEYRLSDAGDHKTVISFMVTVLLSEPVMGRFLCVVAAGKRPIGSRHLRTICRYNLANNL